MLRDRKFWEDDNVNSIDMRMIKKRKKMGLEFPEMLDFCRVSKSPCQDHLAKLVFTCSLIA
jgi:hypothetical protein